MDKIRNFCIVAHIDHGKSTLADRFLEITGTVDKREMKEQMLDTMELEQERGITIKLQPVRMGYKGFILNLIDTPGHVDFSYEVSRSLAAVEGVLLVVDASQGIEAQTLSNVYLALEHNLEIIPVVNKVDLPHAEPEKVAHEIMDLLGVKKEEIIFASGKTGEGVDKILDRVIEKVPAPTGETDKPLRALIFDSFYDPYKGVITYVRIVDGSLTVNQKIHMIANKNNAETLEIGYMKPQLMSEKHLACGEIGYIVTGLKNVSEARVGDTITLYGENIVEALPGYQKVKPFVFAGIYTTEGDDYPLLREALGKLALSDSSLDFIPENSSALGFGFRCGFLGLLHMEIIKERLEREFNLDLIVTIPSVSYEVVKANKEVMSLHGASELPDLSQIKEIREPWTNTEVVTPSDYIGPIMELIQGHRGIFKTIDYLEEKRVIIKAELPLSQIITDFYDQLKSISSGYASMNYELLGYRAGDLVKLDILVGGNLVDTLSLLTHRSEASTVGKKIIEKLKKLIPKQMFKITLQAAVGAKIIAREDIPAFRKDVTAKLYGGDVTRKNKLLNKQKEGKKKMKHLGKVDIPSNAFMELLKKD
ncbi:MAG: translation elongation factor 4 [Patescibacteria group bacterium]|nr:translation elongation factor 4 [Patescibacteria group bacterium]